MKKWLISGALLGIVGFGFRSLLWQTTKPVPEISDLKGSSFLVIAHRGASAHAPENTLAAISKGLEVGADLVEFDVHLSADGEPIVLHDATLDRTTNGSGVVSTKTLAELKALDAGSWFGPDFANEPIPTLKEALEAINGRSKALIEIKVDHQNQPYPGLAERVVATIRSLEAESWCIVQSFEKAYLEETNQIAPELETHQLVIGSLSPLPVYGDTQFRLGYFEPLPFVKAVNPYSKVLSPGRVAALQKDGFKVFTYTVDSREDLLKTISTGVDGIITNEPARLLAIRKELKGK